MNEPTNRRRIRWGDREVELLPPEARHPWLDPLADPAGLTPPPAGTEHASTRRIIIVSCVAAFLAGIAAFTIVSAVRRGADAAPRPSLAPSSTAGRPPATSRPTTATTRPASSRPTTPAPSTPASPGATPSTGASPSIGASPSTTARGRVALGVTVNEDAGGVTITSVSPASGAEAAALRAGDVFVSVDGQTITASADLGDIIRSHRAGDRVTIVVQRDGGDVTVTAVLGTTVS